MRILSPMAFAILFAGTALTAPAQAATYSNTGNNYGYYPLGYPDTTAYGQSFTTPAEGVLSSVTFYANGGSDGNVALVIAAWNGSGATGSELYRGTVAYTSVESGFAPITFSNINLSLTSGQSYIAYLTSFDVASPLSSVTIESAGSSPLGGNFFYRNTDNADPVTAGAWTVTGDNLHYSFTFGAGDGGVPEPATWAMMIAGFGMAGAAMRRRERAAAHA